MVLKVAVVSLLANQGANAQDKAGTAAPPDRSPGSPDPAAARTRVTSDSKEANMP